MGTPNGDVSGLFVTVNSSTMTTTLHSFTEMHRRVKRFPISAKSRTREKISHAKPERAGDGQTGSSPEDEEIPRPDEPHLDVMSENNVTNGHVRNCH